MRANANCLKSSGRNWTKERSNEHHSKARRGRNQAHGEEAPRVLAGRHGDGKRGRRRGRAQERAGLGGRGDRQEEPRHQFLVHRAQSVFGRGRRAHLTDLFPADRLDRAEAQGRRAPCQALLHASALGQGRAHPRENRRPRAGRAVSTVYPLLDEEGCRRRRRGGRVIWSNHPGASRHPSLSKEGNPMPLPRNAFLLERRSADRRKIHARMGLNSIQEIITAEKINFMAKFGRGLVCMPITEAHAERLNLLPMVARNRSVHGTNFTVSIEAASGVTTGISAADRAHTIKVAASAKATPADIVQPGHVFPLIAEAGGGLGRAGHTEACCDLAQLAGLHPAAVLGEIMKDDGSMARLPDLIEFSKHHGLKIGSIADLIHFRSQNESLIKRVTERVIETRFGPFRLIAYLEKISGETQLALVRGEITPDKETLVRVHAPLSVLDLLEAGPRAHSWSVPDALDRSAAEGKGVMVLLNGAESASQLIERVASPERPEGPSKMDFLTYGIGAQILRDLRVGKMRLMASPRKMPSMAGWELEIAGYVEKAARARDG